MYDWLEKIKTPCYVVNEAGLIKNLEILQGIENRTGCKILLAQKAFSMFAMYPLIEKYISGTTASGLYEARLGYEHMSGEVHVYSPAYTEADMQELVKICGCIIFNSPEQFVKYKAQMPSAVSAGLRINPEISTQSHAIYDPCAPYSRLGTTLENMKGKNLTGIQGLHFHTLCEQDSNALEATLDVVIKKFGYLFPKLKWLNMGGGHHITREDYDIERLVRCIERVKSYGLEVYIEPGEAVALNAGWLAASVLDVIHNGINIAILDASAACHMPDVLEMPYRPKVVGESAGNDFLGVPKYTYRLTGNTCLAGDVIGDYSFPWKLWPRDKLLFTDMAIYSMVKNNTFNGMPLPSIAVLKKSGEVDVVREFGYKDFKGRLS